MRCGGGRGRRPAPATGASWASRNGSPTGRSSWATASRQVPAAARAPPLEHAILGSRDNPAAMLRAVDAIIVLDRRRVRLSYCSQCSSLSGSRQMHCRSNLQSHDEHEV